jgi:glutaredoxin
MSWWPFSKKTRQTSSPLHVVIYGRAECHLCDEAEAVLKARQLRHGFRLIKIDVDQSPALIEQFGKCVPVVTIDGRVRFRGRVSPQLLDRFFAGQEK